MVSISGVKKVRASGGSLLLTLTDEFKLIGVKAGDDVYITADSKRVTIEKVSEEVE